MKIGMRGRVLWVVMLAMLLAVVALAGSPTEKQCNKGGAALSAKPVLAQAKTVPGPGKVLGVPQNSSSPVHKGGGDDGLAPQRIPAPAPKAVSATVLWDQPLSAVNQNAYANQDFETSFDAYDMYIADDFTNEVSWNIGTIFVPGNGWNGFTTLMNATGLTWAIYADQGVMPSGPISTMGIPDGYPGGGNAPYWTITLPPTDPQVAITTGTGGYPSDSTLTLVTPISLPAGHWWLVFYPSLSFTAGAGQFGRQPADTANGDPAHVINPQGGFGFPAIWTSVTSTSTWGLTTQDFAFRLEDAGCAETVQDGSFEFGSPSIYWTEASINFGTPLCTAGGCGTGGGTTGPHTGAWWAWFGGTSAPEAGSVEQSVTIPAGTASLTFWAWYGNQGLATDYTRALVDGNEIWRANGDSVDYPVYTLVTLDVSAYADGATHLLRFESANGSGESTYNFSIDDVSLVSCVNPCSTIHVFPPSLPTPTLGVPYSVSFGAFGGTDPYTFEVTAGTLPPGLVLAADGTLSGTLTALGDYSFTVTATDSLGCTGEQTYGVASFSAYFLDDQGRSKLCVNRLTGDYIWEISSGPGMGTYTGVANIINGGTKIYSKPGASDYLNCTYDAIKKRAAGYYLTAAGEYSALKDYNTTNNEGGCFGVQQPN